MSVPKLSLRENSIYTAYSLSGMKKWATVLELKEYADWLHNVSEFGIELYVYTALKYGYIKERVRDEATGEIEYSAKFAGKLKQDYENLEG